MEKPLAKIKRLSKFLPSNDIKFANKYIESREFDKLLEIVDSDIDLVHQNSISDNPKEKYNNIDLDKLVELSDTINYYLDLIEFPKNGWYD